MNDKLLNTYEIVCNNETVKIQVFETQKGIKVCIDGQYQDVIVNGEELYSRFDQEEYKYIPSKLRPFIEKHLDYDIEVKNNEVIGDLCLNGRGYMFILLKNRSKNNNFILRDWIYDYNKIEENCEIKISNAKNNWVDLNNKIKDLGYQLCYSHDSDIYDNYYDLVIPINKFNESMIMKCVKLWDDYNNELDKYITY